MPLLLIWMLQEALLLLLLLAALLLLLMFLVASCRDLQLRQSETSLLFKYPDPQPSPVSSWWQLVLEFALVLEFRSCGHSPGAESFERLEAWGKLPASRSWVLLLLREEEEEEALVLLLLLLSTAVAVGGNGMAAAGGRGSGGLTRTQEGVLEAASWGAEAREDGRLLSWCSCSDDDGSDSSEALVDCKRGRRTRQTGQVGCFSSQGSTQLVWKMWPQAGNCRRTSDSSYSNKQMGHLHRSNPNKKTEERSEEKAQEKRKEESRHITAAENWERRRRGRSATTMFKVLTGYFLLPALIPVSWARLLSLSEKFPTLLSGFQTAPSTTPEKHRFQSDKKQQEA